MKRFFGFVCILMLATYGLQAGTSPAPPSSQPSGTSKPLEMINPIPILKAQIDQVVPLYDDCQLIFDVIGKFFGTNTQGTRQVRLVSATKTYIPQVTAWTATKITCRLQGEFELGRRYKVGIWTTATNTLVSNELVWQVKTQIKGPANGYQPGTNYTFSGCLLGSAQGARQVMVGNTPAQVTLWCCEDIIIKVPNLPAGVYNLYLKEGVFTLSNIIQLTIL